MVLLWLWLLSALAGTGDQTPEDRRHFVSSSAFVLFNLLPFEEGPPAFYQLNYGYRLTPQDVIVVEAITWRYYSPLGIPAWSASYGDREQGYPGSVRDLGVGLAYQRFLWKGVYSSVHAMPFLQQYFDADEERIQTGFQLYLTLRFGYHLAFWKDRLFVEPAVAYNTWPVNTNLPASFAAREGEWPSYFLFEPSLHVGVKF